MLDKCTGDLSGWIENLEENRNMWAAVQKPGTPPQAADDERVAGQPQGAADHRAEGVADDEQRKAARL